MVSSWHHVGSSRRPLSAHSPPASQLKISPRVLRSTWDLGCPHLDFMSSFAGGRLTLGLGSAGERWDSRSSPSFASQPAWVLKVPVSQPTSIRKTAAYSRSTRWRNPLLRSSPEVSCGLHVAMLDPQPLQADVSYPVISSSPTVSADPPLPIHPSSRPGRPLASDARSRLCLYHTTGCQLS